MLEPCKSSTKNAVALVLTLAIASCAPAQSALLQLSSQGKLLPTAALYTCTAIAKDLKCLSAVADDTAHLSENPDARIVQTNGTISVVKKMAIAVAFYVAEEKTLLDDPKYAKLDSAQGKLTLPPDSERRVLIAIYESQGAKTKAVWLLAPTR